MSNFNFSSIEAALKKPWLKRFGFVRSSDLDNIDGRMDNGAYLEAADTTDVRSRALHLIGSDSSNQVRVAGSVYRPVRQAVNINMPLTADCANKLVFVAPFAMRLVAVTEIHGTANGATLTAQITKEAAGSPSQTVGTGVSLLASAFNLNATAATLQTGTLTTAKGATTLAQGDRISFYLASGSASSIAGVQVTLWFEPGCHKTLAVFNGGTIVDQLIYIANYPQTVEAVYWVHGTAGTSPTIQLEKCTGTTAAGSGTELLTNNSNAGFSGSAAAYTMQTGTLTGTVAGLDLVAGDRLAVDFAGTLGSLANVVMVVVLTASNRYVNVTLRNQANGSNVDQAFFTADRPYRIYAAREAHTTAGTDGSAVNLQLEVCRRTTAVGSGAEVLSNNSSAGFDMKGTANTVQIGTFIGEAATPTTIHLNPGDRLVADYAGTITTLAGAVATVTLEAI